MNVVGKYAVNKVLRGEAKEYINKKVGGDKDPYFMNVEDPRTGKTKKVKKLIPNYIPEKDAEILAKFRKWAYRFDMSFNLGPLRFGYSSLIGIIPGFGDFADAAMAFWLVQQAKGISCGLGSGIVMQMYAMILVDLFIGLVPFLGDILDSLIKANTYNLRLLEQRLDEAYKPDGKEEKVKWNGSKRAPPPATAWEDFDDEDAERQDFIREQKEQERMQRPQPAATRNDTRGGRGGWFSNSRGTRREHDVEMAQAPSVQESGTVYNGRR